MSATKSVPSHASLEVTLTLETEFSDPTVTLTLYQQDRTTEVPGISWPLTMTKVADEPKWSVVVPCGELEWSPGDMVYRLIDFDDGPENCRHIWEPWRVLP